MSERIAAQLRSLAQAIEAREELTNVERAELTWYRELWSRTKLLGLELVPAKTALVGGQYAIGWAHEIREEEKPVTILGGE